jgi:hypothetical protein
MVPGLRSSRRGNKTYHQAYILHYLFIAQAFGWAESSAGKDQHFEKMRAVLLLALLAIEAHDCRYPAQDNFAVFLP